MRPHRLDPFSLLFGATLGDARRSIWPMVAILVGCGLAAWAVLTVVRDRRSSDLEAPDGDNPPA
jgi:hypothetical protein